MPSAAYTLLPTEPLSYVNVETGACGSVSTALPDKVVTALLQAPPIAPGQAQSFVGLLKNTIGGSGVALPQTFKTTNLRSEKPVPHLYVYYTDSLKTESRLLLTDVHFYYGKIKVAHTDTREFLTEAQGHTLVQWERNHEQEAHFLQTLSEHEIISIMKMHFTDFFYRYRNSFQHAYYIAHEDDVDKINGFKNRMIPHLKKAGWQIEFANILLQVRF